jgi:hypothetical protein
MTVGDFTNPAPLWREELNVLFAVPRLLPRSATAVRPVPPKPIAPRWRRCGSVVRSGEVGHRCGEAEQRVWARNRAASVRLNAKLSI